MPFLKIRPRGPNDHRTLGRFCVAFCWASPKIEAPSKKDARLQSPAFGLVSSTRPSRASFFEVSNLIDAPYLGKPFSMGKTPLTAMPLVLIGNPPQKTNKGATKLVAQREFVSCLPKQNSSKQAESPAKLAFLCWVQTTNVLFHFLPKEHANHANLSRKP